MATPALMTPVNNPVIANRNQAQTAFNSIPSLLPNQSAQNQTPAVPVPVITADKAATDFAQKQQGFQQIQQGIANQNQAVQTQNAIQVQGDEENARIAQELAIKKTQADAQAKKAEEMSKVKESLAQPETPTNEPSATQTATNTANEQLTENSKRQEDAYNQFKTDIDSLRNGTFPLTEVENAQISAIQAKFDRLKQQQEIANKNYEGGIRQLGIVSGRSRYAPEMEIGNIQNAVSVGIQKIADIESKAAEAVTTLKQAFEERNYKLINTQYAALTDYLKQKSETINQINKNVQEEADRLQKKEMDRLAVQESEIRIQKGQQELIKNNLDSFVSGLVDLDEAGNVTLADEATLQDLAAQTGIPYAQIVGSMRTKAYELSKLSQEDRKRELDIAKAQRDVIPQMFQEYDEAVKRGFTGSPLEWLSQKNASSDSPLDIAQKKLQIQKLQKDISSESGLDTKQTTNFLRITDKFQADEVIKNGNKGVNAVKIADQVLANPGNAANQLKILYTLVKNLDPDSAVREGELSLASQTQSFLDRQKTNLEKLSEGKLLSTSATKELANATKELAQLWFDAAQNREKQYKSQASVAGVGDAFQQYLGGFEQVYNQNERGFSSINDFAGRATSEQLGEFNSLRRQFPNKTPEEIFEFWQEESFNPEGSVSSNAQQGGSVSWRHNNPLNIKYGSFAQGYGATPGQKATDGGQFAKFPSVEEGLKAAKSLLQAPSYANLNLEQAMRRWSGNGYGRDVAPNLPNVKIKDLTPKQVDSLIKSMQQREGWTEGKSNFV